MTSKTSKPGHPSRGKNWLEWVVFTLSCVLIASVLGFLTFEAWRAGDEPARVVASIGKAEQHEGWTHLSVTFHNRGDEVASNVEMTVIARSAGREAAGTLSVAEIPRNASHEGRVSFPFPVEAREIEVGAIGYDSK